MTQDNGRGYCDAPLRGLVATGFGKASKFPLAGWQDGRGVWTSGTRVDPVLARRSPHASPGICHRWINQTERKHIYIRMGLSSHSTRCLVSCCDISTFYNIIPTPLEGYNSAATSLDFSLNHHSTQLYSFSPLTHTHTHIHTPHTPHTHTHHGHNESITISRAG